MVIFNDTYSIRPLIEVHSVQSSPQIVFPWLSLISCFGQKIRQKKFSQTIIVNLFTDQSVLIALSPGCVCKKKSRKVTIEITLSSSGSSSRMGGARNMKSMQPPLAAIFFITYFYLARWVGGGGMAQFWPPGSATAFKQNLRNKI